MMYPIGSIEIEMDDEKYRLVIPTDCTGYEAACLAHMLAFATVSNTALDFKTYIQEHQIERLWVKVATVAKVAVATAVHENLQKE